MNVIDAPTATPSASHSSEGSDPRQATLVASLRARYAIAEQRQDADAKRALFKEAVYLGIRPDAYQGSSSAA
ncbi:hypothetical protein [Synechococcus sp. FACHB-909]|jgi:hypothetical protein|uniref:hypothetical protein n=1 Tax=Synechococcus sp. FACHB-909 TaxID=2692863 RepID=UPI001686F5D6|nr:hypothetical protein [Synechococcus sp. FACHB-909]MBD2720304.1 hypothetical protein [Synechococcus sp. FACHB-909]